MKTDLLKRLTATSPSPANLLIRLSLGLVFLPEGIQKLVFPELLGVGRFIKIGIPSPELMGPFVGCVEMICGAMILIGLQTRLAAIPLVIIMLVAIISTKISILLGHDWWVFHVSSLPRYGFWSFMHETRADWAMLMGALFLFIEGGGRWSLDNVLRNRA